MAHSKQQQRPASTVSCLKKIDQLSVAAIMEQPLASRYSKMKLGIKTDIAYFAEQMLPLAQQKITANPYINQWVITTPPYNAIPAAANYICWKIYEQLKQAPDLADRLTKIDLKIPKERLKINNANDFKTFHEYSKNSIEQRIKERARLHHGDDDIITRADDFKNCGVIVINDIKVTGTQQEFMQQSFDKVGLACLHWLYIFEVDQQLGKSDPQIEHRINATKISSWDEYRKIFCSTDINYTARCISSLFAYDIKQFEYLLQQISPPRRLMILDLVQKEGRYDGDFFAEKYQLLQKICHQANQHEILNTVEM